MCEDKQNATLAELDQTLPARQMPGGFDEYEAGSAQAAVEWASKMKSEGRYQYFRGQRDARWSMDSSFARLNAVEKARANEQIADFIDWVRGAQDLVPYLPEEAMIIAAAQHHQVAATTYIDFSTEPEVAGWFAKSGAIEGDTGVIYLVNADEVEELFAALSKKGSNIGFEKFDVPNLWRLEAQSGLFLKAECDVEKIWPFDRVVFPQDGKPSIIEERSIYPERRSHLEQVIEGYKNTRIKERNWSNLMEMAERNGAAVINIEPPGDTVSSGLSSHEVGRGWLDGPNESWAAMARDSTPKTWTLEDILGEPETLLHYVDARRQSLEFLNIKKSSRFDDEVQRSFARLWEGMRPHPYSSQQIAAATASLAQLTKMFEGYEYGAGNSMMPQAILAMSDPVEMEMGISGRESTRFYGGAQDIADALDQTWRKEYLGDGIVQSSDLMAALHQTYGSCLHLFEPLRFTDLFARTIIPWQIASRRSVICWSPFHVTTFGRP